MLQEIIRDIIPFKFQLYNRSHSAITFLAPPIQLLIPTSSTNSNRFTLHVFPAADGQTIPGDNRLTEWHPAKINTARSPTHLLQIWYLTRSFPLFTMQRFCRRNANYIHDGSSAPNAKTTTTTTVEWRKCKSTLACDYNEYGFTIIQSDSARYRERERNEMCAYYEIYVCDGGGSMI